MARIKNVSGDDRTLAGRLVLAGQVVEVPDEDVESYTCQTTIWVLAPTKSEAAKSAPAAKKETK